MAQRINLLLLFITWLTFLFVCAVSFKIEISIFSAASIPYKQEILDSVGIVMAVLFVPFAIGRWASLRSFKRAGNEGLVNVKISKKGRQWMYLYGGIESLYSVVFGIAIYSLLDIALFPALVLIIRALDNLIFIVIGNKDFGIHLNNEALAVSFRASKLINLSKIARVERRFDELLLQSRSGGSNIVPLAAISEEDQLRLITAFKEVCKERKIYFSNAVDVVKDGF